jgi:hypothetical protein
LFHFQAVRVSAACDGQATAGRRRVPEAASLSVDPSEHATARAIDISGCEVSDGSTISVGRDWKDTGLKGRFLHLVDRQACDLFHTALSPSFNAAHASHLHLDVGRIRSCL